jgi:hypothetical protein
MQSAPYLATAITVAFIHGIISINWELNTKHYGLTTSKNLKLRAIDVKKHLKIRYENDK